MKFSNRFLVKTFNSRDTVSVHMAEDFLPEGLERLKHFIADTVAESGSKAVVLGLSGGLDSAVVSRLCVEALGGENVLTVFMPSASTPTDDWDNTKSHSRSIGCEYRLIPIERMVGTICSDLKADDPLSRGNITARCRMIVLYHIARAEDRLVVGTGNKSELLMGYFTKYGDGACDMLPIGGLYKTQVYLLAGLLGVPQEIIDRKPSADLWEGQSDEEELGIRYEELDLILSALERGRSPEEIAAIINIPMERIMAIEQRVESNRHKRQFPPVAEL